MELVAQWRVLWSLLIGVLGSLSYFTVVYYGLGSSFQSRDYILSFFRGATSVRSTVKVLSYCAMGGFIASIFQLPQGEFVPIQSFVLGATWPSIVGQLLSGRQMGPSTDELNRLGIPPGTAATEDAELLRFQGALSQLLSEPETDVPPDHVPSGDDAHNNC